MSAKLIPALLMLVLSRSAWSASLQDNADGTVSDYDTGLMWQQLDDDSPRDWNAAISYCDDLVLAGKTGWRLPYVKELDSIVDDRVHTPSIDDTFFPQTKGAYWSATSSASNSANAWIAVFVNGGLVTLGKAQAGARYVRCVR